MIDTINNVVIFSASWCSGCKSVKKTLEAEGVGFVEVDIDTEAGMNLAKEYQVRNIPVTYIKGERYIGSSPQTIQLMKEAIGD